MIIIKKSHYLVYLGVIARVVGELDGDGLSGALRHRTVQLLGNAPVSNFRSR